MQYHVAVVSNRRGMRDFLDLPAAIYRNDPHWVAPLRSEVRHTLDTNRNPYFRNAFLRLFVCYRDGMPAGRMSAVIDLTQERVWGERIAFFGFFESIDDAEVARRLFAAAEEYCRRRGATRIEGPFNPNHYSELGLQASHFDAEPVFFQPHNPPYYIPLLEGSGYVVSKRIHTRVNPDFHRFVREQFPPPAPHRNDGYTIRSFDMRRMERDLEAVRSVFNDAFATNWRFVPVTREEYNFSAAYLRFVTEPDLVRIVEHDGVPVGVLQCVLDINPILKPMGGRIRPLDLLRFPARKKSIDRVIMYAVGIRKAHRCSRVIQLLYEATRDIGRRYRTLEATWMYDDNRMAVHAAERLGMRREKEFLLFEKPLATLASPPAGGRAARKEKPEPCETI